MSLMVFPALVRGLTFTVTKTPQFDTEIESAANKYDWRIPQTVNPFWNFQLIYEYLKDFPWDLVSGLITTDFNTMMDFFLAQGGQSGTFLFRDPDDNQVYPAMKNGSPNNPLAALPNTVNDGAGNYYTPFQRTFGGNFYEDITDLNLDPTQEGLALAVYSNGVLQVQGGGGDYTVSSTPGLAVAGASFMGQYIIWNALPNPSATFTLGKVAGGTTVPAATYYVKVTRESASGNETLASGELSIVVGVNAPLAGPVLTQSPGGTDPANTIYAIATYVNGFGESTGSPQTNLSKGANELISAASPPAAGDATGWNLYLGVGTTTCTKVNSTPIAIGTAWNETTSGIPTGGAAVPSSSTSLGRPTVSGFATTGKTNDAGWNVYVSTTTGTETKQNSSMLTYLSTWTMPSGGLISGAQPPSINTTGMPASPVTAQFGFYFRVRFGSDMLDFEKFMNRLWCIGGDFSKNGSGTMKLCTSRPTPL